MSITTEDVQAVITAIREQSQDVTALPKATSLKDVPEIAGVQNGRLVLTPHTGVYSPSDHNHDAAYAAKSHNHMGQTIWPASIEVSSATPLIDFHYNNSTDDYNARLIMYDRTSLTMDGADLNVRTKLWAAGGVESWGTNGPGCYFNGPMRGGNTYRQPHSASFVVVYQNNGDRRYGIGWDDNAKTARIGACTNKGEWIGGDLTFDFKGTVKATNITELETKLQDCLSRIEALEA